MGTKTIILLTGTVLGSSVSVASVSSKPRLSSGCSVTSRTSTFVWCSPLPDDRPPTPKMFHNYSFDKFTCTIYI